MSFERVGPGNKDKEENMLVQWSKLLALYEDMSKIFKKSTHNNTNVNKYELKISLIELCFSLEINVTNVEKPSFRIRNILIQFKQTRHKFEVYFLLKTRV